MTHIAKVVLVVVCALCLFSFVQGKERTKRELKFPKGASFVTAVALSSFLPKGPTDGLIHVLEFDLGFPFPEQFAIGKKQADKKLWKSTDKKWYKPKKTAGKWKRTKRNTKEEQKKDLLVKLEDAINRTGFNGTSCMGRFRCELRDIPPGNSLLEQLLFALFEPMSQTECEGHEKDCPISLLQIIMHSEQVSNDSGRRKIEKHNLKIK